MSRVTFRILAAVIMAGLFVSNPVRHLNAVLPALAQQAQTVWDGIYTEEQAKRGEVIFSDTCATCHGPDLMGIESAPGLTGRDFRSNWDGLSVGDLFDRIRLAMPKDKPGSMAKQQYADVLAFLLLRSDFPVGKAELASKTELLKQIQFVATKP